eukprot:scaffold3061_cov430-Prasinococcus_capsulatus_cf.AAC.2
MAPPPRCAPSRIGSPAWCCVEGTSVIEERGGAGTHPEDRAPRIADTRLAREKRLSDLVAAQQPARVGRQSSLVGLFVAKQLYDSYAPRRGCSSLKLVSASQTYKKAGAPTNKGSWSCNLKCPRRLAPTLTK